MEQMQLGKVPPHAADLEAAVLGAIMLEGDKIDQVLSIFQGHNPFYKQSNRVIFDAIKRLYNEGDNIDLLTVAQELERKGQLAAIGGQYTLTGITMDVVSSAHVQAHSLILMEKFLARELIQAGSDMISNAFADTYDVFSILEKMQNKLFDLSMQNISIGYDTLSESVEKNIRELMERKAMMQAAPEQLEANAIVSGFSSFDDILYRFRGGNVYIIAARPSMGKTTLAHNIALNVAKDGHGVAFFSLEMTTEDLSERMLANYASVPYHLIQKAQTGDSQDKDLTNAKDEIKSLRFYIDSGEQSLLTLTAKARQLVQKNRVEIIFIDYLQLITPERGTRDNREQQVSKISRGLKNLAMMLNIPIVLLSQLSRDIEKRGGEPMLSDLRGSGSLEQDATMVAFLARSDYQRSDALGGTGENIAVIDVKKYRGGKLGKAQIKPNLAFQRFENMTSPFQIEAPKGEFRLPF